MKPALPTNASAPPDVKPFLDYLEREMTIMGVLSAFCLATVSLALKELLEASPSVPLGAVWSGNRVIVLVASGATLGAGGFFYWQRSILAWLYGQIALCRVDPEVGGCSLREWLEEADSWRTWIQYRWGLTMMCSGLIGYVVALASSTASASVRADTLVTYVFGIAVATVIMGRVAYLLKTHPFDDQPVTLRTIFNMPPS